MDAGTGKLYDDVDAARAAIAKRRGDLERDLVEITGPPRTVKRIARSVRADRKRKAKQAKRSRRGNR